jgi:hypothetical protein
MDGWWWWDVQTGRVIVLAIPSRTRNAIFCAPRDLEWARGEGEGLNEWLEERGLSRHSSFSPNFYPADLIEMCISVFNKVDYGLELWRRVKREELKLCRVVRLCKYLSIKRRLLAYTSPVAIIMNICDCRMVLWKVTISILVWLYSSCSDVVTRYCTLYENVRM